MTRRRMAVLWLVVGIVLWNVVFDLHVSRGVREYLQLHAESELARGVPPAMGEVMARSRRAGAIAASVWAGCVVACGWMTILLASRPARKA